MCEPQPAGLPWWLVPNVLALDAPLVAVVWQRFLAARAGVVVPWAATAALGAVVWAVYLADRWLDARRGAIDADRHRAAARRPVAFAVAAAAAGCLATAAAALLPTSYLWAGAAVSAGVVAYLALAHAVAGGLRSLPGAKEFLVAVGFAAGVAIPLGVSDQPPASWLPGAAAFAGVCWLNCRLIDRWESAGPGGGSLRWGDGLLGGLLLAGSPGLPAAVGLAVAGSTAGLLGVHLACRRHPRAARALADAVLLVPLAVGGVP
jgi:hypothetical protein